MSEETVDGAQTNTETPEDESTATLVPPSEKVEVKPEEGEKAEEKAAEAEKGEAPESYDLSLPKDSLLDPSTVDEISAYAKQKGLSNEDAQELLTRENEAVERFQESQLEEVEKIRNGWVEEVKADEELGGDNFKQNAEYATQIVEEFGSDKLKDLLKETGFGNHPEVVRLFKRIGEAKANDKFVMARSQESGREKTAAEVFYPSTSPTT